MKRKYLFIAFIIGGCVLGAWIINRYQHGRTLHVQFKSPKETYLVKLDADDAPDPDPLFPFPNDYRNRIVRATILANNQPYLSNFVIYSGDAFDVSFLDVYPDHEWLSESILYLGGDKRQGMPREKGQIIVSNQSDESLSYMFLRAAKANIFFILDLPAGSTTELPVYLDRLARYIGCEGKFIGGESFKFQEVGFSKQEQSPIHYCIKVEKSSILIQSRELDGTNLDKIAVPKGNCGL